MDVIRSEATTGPVTELALSGVFKFLSYELIGKNNIVKFVNFANTSDIIDPNNESAAITVESIADSVTHARFVGTDSGHDEVVLMKILQVLAVIIVYSQFPINPWNLGFADAGCQPCWISFVK